MSENVEIANAETVAWGNGPVLPPAGPPTKTWQAPAVIAVFLVIALVAAGVGIALGSGTSEEDLVAASKNAPKVGVCRTYDDAAAAAATNDSPAVACSEPHSAETYAVVDVLPAPGSGGLTDRQVQDAGEINCSYPRAAKALGLSDAELATTRFTVAFFAPTAAEVRDGARWIRCDLVLNDGGQSSTVAGSFKELAEIPGAFAQCTGVSIGNGSGAPVRCTDSAELSAVIGTVPTDDVTSEDDATEVRSECRELAVEASGLGEPSWAAVLPRNVGEDGSVAFCLLRDDQWKVDRSAWPAEQTVGGAGDTVSV